MPAFQSPSPDWLLLYPVAACYAPASSADLSFITRASVISPPNVALHTLFYHLPSWFPPPLHPTSPLPPSLPPHGSKSSSHGTAPISSLTIAAISLLTSTCPPPPSFPSRRAFRVNDTDRCSLQPFLKALTHNQRPLHSAAGLSSPLSVSRRYTKNPPNTHTCTHKHAHTF